MAQRARPIRRILATVVDLLIFWIASWLISILVEPPLRAWIQTEWRADYVLSLIMLALWLLYSSLEMIVAATPGKMLLGVRIARMDGEVAPASMLLMRWSTKQFPYILSIFQLITFSPFLGAFANLMNLILWIGCLQMLDEDRRSWLDWWARPAVIPLVNDLIENSCIGMLGNEAGAQQLHAHAGDLFDQNGIIHEPPAAEKHQVAVLAGGDGQFVLIFAREHGDQKFVLKILREDAIDAGDVGLANRVAGESKPRIHLPLHADHHRKRKISLAADGENRLFENFGGGRFVGIAECGRERDGHVNRAHAVDPFGQKSADFLHGIGAEVGGCRVTKAVERVGDFGPANEDGIDSQHRFEARIDRRFLQPQLALGGIEGVVGHHHRVHVGELKNFVH